MADVTTQMWGFSSAGRAPALHAGGQEFESPNLHHLKSRAERLFFSINDIRSMYMFRQPNFSNLRFNIIQAINPYIQNSSNKYFGKSIISLPNNKVKSTINLPKKLLNKNFKLTSQPSVDMVTLSPDAKIANVSKPTQDSKVAYGKLIKKVLNRYFDNDNIATDFQKDKKANLKQLVKEFEREQYRKYVAPRKKAKKLMNEDAVEKYKMMQQDIREEENENRKFFNLYLDQFQDWDDLASLEC